MMKKIIKHTVLLFFFQIYVVSATCLTDKADFGSSLNSLKQKVNVIENPPLIPGTSSLFVPGDVICQNNK